MREFCEANLENSFECQILHQYYLLLKTEGKNRESLNGLIHLEDGYLDYKKNKTANQKQTQDLEHTRLTGKICPNCQSSNIRSNGSMWTCRDCKKSFRKHF
jgi:hypothetical protein